MDRPILLFDVMDTLVSEPFVEAVPRFFQMTLSELYQAKSKDAYLDFEHGRIDEDEYVARFFQDGRLFDVQGLKRALYDSYEWLDGMQSLVSRLRSSGAQMHTLSNYSPWYELIEDKLGISRYMNWTFVSCQTGLRKPDAAAYLHAASTLKVDPGRCVFIDDRPVNVQGATDVGMHSILRTDTPSLIEALKRFGFE